MAERLTNKNTVSVYNNSNSEIYLSKGEEATKYIYKLAQLEDIMEKYDIEDLEQYLLKMRKVDKELRDTIQQLHTIIDSIGYDRDTWKRACELACKELEKRNCFAQDKQTRRIVDLKDYFYQQAKQFAGR